MYATLGLRGAVYALRTAKRDSFQIAGNLAEKGGDKNMVVRSISEHEFKKIKESSQMSKHNNSVKPVSGITTISKPEAKDIPTDAVEGKLPVNDVKEVNEPTPETPENNEATPKPEVTLESLLAELLSAGETNEEAKSMHALFSMAPKNDMTFKAVQTYMTGMDAKKKAEEPLKWEKLTNEIYDFARNKLAEAKLNLNDRYILITASGASNQIGTYTKARSGGGKRLGFTSSLGKPTYNGETIEGVTSPTALARELGFKTLSYASTEEAFTDHGFKVERADGNFTVTGVKGTTVTLKKGPSELRGTTFTINR